MGLAISPLAPASLPELPAIAGVRLAAAGFELRYKNRPDLWLAVMDEGAVAAGVFTLSTTAAPPVLWSRTQLHEQTPRALLVNAGQANAFTGERGMAAIEVLAQEVAVQTGCAPTEVLMASTGVIGQHIPVEKMKAAIPTLASTLASDGWAEAAQAIRTTDTFPKASTRCVAIGDASVMINGIAKGSGMIAPNMATLLAFVFTDATLPAALWQELLAEANQLSFNSITVDGDCSTNDTLIGFATCKAQHAAVSDMDDEALQPFRLALREVLMDLAQQVVRDGEGAQKFITVNVSGATSDLSAHIIAMAIANSPLIKTAIAGEDANWGRVVMAIGKTGEPVDQKEIAIGFGPYPIARGGAVIEGYDETPVAAYMKGSDIVLHVQVGRGGGNATVWTCDLTHGYIAINADYRS